MKKKENKEASNGVRVITIPKGVTHIDKEVLKMNGFDSFPSGRIMKTYTGIGATTCELEDMNRNTLLVMPTRALAKTKAINDIFYLGSPFPDRHSDTLEDLKSAIKSGNKGKAVKACFVADTFVRIFMEDPDFFQKHFHLFLDEIDTFQSEAGYRMPLDDVMEIYSSFEDKRKTMISATLQKFLHVKLQNQTLTKVFKVDWSPFQVNLFQSLGNFPSDIADVIKRYQLSHPDTKILVALNEIEEILNTIAAIGDIPACHIMCGDKSHHKVPNELLKESFDKKLERPITFMTSSFFVGVDILEDCVVIAAADYSSDYKILTQAKIMQIFGRPRTHNTKSRAFVFRTDKSKKGNLNEMKSHLNQAAKFDVNVCNSYVKKPNLSDAVWNEYNIEHCKYARRVLSKTKCDRRYMFLDSAYQLQKALNDLYCEPDHTRKVLRKNTQLEILDLEPICKLIELSTTKTLKEINELRKQKSTSEQILITEEIYDELLKTYFLDFSDTKTHTKKTHTEIRKAINKQLEGVFWLINKDFEADKKDMKEGLLAVIIGKIKKKNTHKSRMRVDDIERRLNLLSLLKNRKIEEYLDDNFKVGEAYSKSEIVDAIFVIYPEIQKSYPKVKPLNDLVAMEIFNCWFKSKRVQSTDKVTKVKVKKFKIEFLRTPKTAFTAND